MFFNNLKDIFSTKKNEDIGDIKQKAKIYIELQANLELTKLTADIDSKRTSWADYQKIHDVTKKVMAMDGQIKWLDRCRLIHQILSPLSNLALLFAIVLQIIKPPYSYNCIMWSTIVCAAFFVINALVKSVESYCYTHLYTVYENYHINNTDVDCLPVSESKPTSVAIEETQQKLKDLKEMRDEQLPQTT